MSSWTNGRATLALSGGFFLVLVVLVGLSQALLPDPEVLIEPVFVAIALAPAVVYLAVTGRLQSLRGGGFEVSLRQQAGKVVAHEGADRQLAVEPEKTQQKVSLAALLDLDEGRPPTTLTFTLDRWGYYSAYAIERYLEELGRFPDFRYVVFTESAGSGPDRFAGYMPASAFEALVESDRDVVEELETSAILDDPRVSRAAVRFDQTNREALAAMEATGATELAVTGPQGAFVGFVTQDEIVRTILTESIQDLSGGPPAG